VAVLEPWVEGAAISVSMLCGALGRVAVDQHQQHRRRRRGDVSYRGVDIDVVDRTNPLGRQIEKVALQVARAGRGCADSSVLISSQRRKARLSSR